MAIWDKKPELEKDVEKYLVKKLASLGYAAEKFQTPYKRSAPDRIVWMQNGNHFFIEVKREGQTPTEKQLKDHAIREERGDTVFIIVGKKMVDILTNELEVCARDLIVLKDKLPEHFFPSFYKV